MEYFYTFAEHWRTFFYDWGYLKDVGGRVGGFATLLSDFFLQFSVTPFLGTLVMALELGLIVFLLDRLTARISGTHLLLPMAFLPALALLVMHSNVNYDLGGTMALIIMLACANWQRRYTDFRGRLAFSMVSAVLMLLLLGPVAALYVVVLLLLEFCDSPISGLYFLLPVASVALLGQCCVWLGWTADLRHTLLPYGYFNLMLSGGSILVLPWGLLLADVVAACFWKIFRLGAKWLVWSLFAVQVLAVAWFGLFRLPKYIDKGNLFLMELSYEVAHEDWDGVLDTCSGTPMKNLIHQNYLNLALAEKGMLGDYLFTYPSYDIQSLYVKETRNPWLYPVLSDVYFSMGHMALSQRHAFESLQTFGNYSPRLLKRLVQTNEVMGYDAVGAKYRRLLSKTLFYRKWAGEYMVPDDVRGCVIAVNNFSGEHGLDRDLAQVVKADPGHRQTVQYLGSLCLLLRDVGRFRGFLETFYGTEALPEVLPVAFQEGVVAFAKGDESILKHYRIDQEVISRYETYRSSHLKEKNSFWYFLNDKL